MGDPTTEEGDEKEEINDALDNEITNLMNRPADGEGSDNEMDRITGLLQTVRKLSCILVLWNIFFLFLMCAVFGGR